MIQALGWKGILMLFHQAENNRCFPKGYIWSLQNQFLIVLVKESESGRLYRQYTLLLLYVLKITFSLEKMFGYFIKAVCISIMYVQKELTSMWNSRCFLGSSCLKEHTTMFFNAISVKKSWGQVAILFRFSQQQEVANFIYSLAQSYTHQIHLAFE